MLGRRLTPTFRIIQYNREKHNFQEYFQFCQIASLYSLIFAFSQMVDILFFRPCQFRNAMKKKGKNHSNKTRNENRISVVMNPNWNLGNLLFWLNFDNSLEWFFFLIFPLNIHQNAILLSFGVLHNLRSSQMKCLRSTRNNVCVHTWSAYVRQNIQSLVK